MNKIRNIFLKTKLNQNSESLENLQFAVQVKPHIFVLGLFFGSILGFILTGGFPESSSSQADFSSTPLEAIK